MRVGLKFGFFGLKEEMINEEETYKIIGACMEVHKTLGNGFLEAVYQEALEVEFKSQNIPYEREKQLQIKYKGEVLTKYYVSDFICYDCIIVETKAISGLGNPEQSQVLNYMKATDIKLGLLVNFGQKSLEYKRILNEYYF